MSFSKDVKEELFSIIPKSRHCIVAELAGIFLMHGIDIHKSISDDALQRKVFTLLNKTRNIGKDVTAMECIGCFTVLAAVLLGNNPDALDTDCSGNMRQRTVVGGDDILSKSCFGDNAFAC